MTNLNRVRLSKLSIGLAIALAAAPAFAQTTSSGIGGRIATGEGAPIAGADVTITHVQSGTVNHAITDAQGRYAARGLRVGGPYTVTVVKDGKTETRENVYLQLNAVANVDVIVGPVADATTLATVEVTGVADAFNPDNKGLGTSISGRQLETAVSGNRSLDDIARLDPRITVTDQTNGQISMAGQNNRYNNISVDGLSVNDPFGLKDNGLGFDGAPVSVDTIAAYDIKVTEFDVGSDSVGANINAVTKSGTNEFKGTAYYALTDGSSMVGDREGSDFNVFDTNKTVGATFGGPLLNDRLFFFLSREDQKITGIAGVGADAVSNGLLSQTQVDAVTNAFRDIGVEPGTGGGSSITQESERTLAKIDWNISDYHRASFTYQRTEEARPTPYTSYVWDHSVVTPNNWYTVASETDNYSVQLFSDWSENFSTELKVGYQTFDNTNGASLNQPEVWACFSSTPCLSVSYNSRPSSIPANVPWVVAGEDRFRHENAINSKRFTGTLFGTYYAGDHTIKGGLDFLQNEIGNLFGQGLHGSYGFYDKNGNGTPADEIAAGDYFYFAKQYLPDGVTLETVAGTWTYTQLSPFIQDTWQVNDSLSIVYGARVNIPDADRAPPVAVAGTGIPGVTAGEPVWESVFGYPSNTTLGSDNLVIEPRFAFNYRFDTERQMQLRGGLGLFQSIPPYAWMTNPYQNNGVTSLRSYASGNPVADPFSPDPYNQPGPTSVTTGVCSATSACTIDVLDPDFKLPSTWKLSLGLDIELPWGLTGTIDYLHLQAQDAIVYTAPNVGTPNGTLPDGRDSYWRTYPTPGAGIGSGANNGAIPGIGTGSTLLSNTDKGHTDSITFALSKAMSHGFSGNVALTLTDSTEVTPGTASVAFSNYNYPARVNPNDSVEATSRFEIPLSFKASVSWEHAFFGDYKTSVTMFYNGHDGLPYSWNFGNDINGDSLSFDDLAYIPLVNDPLVRYNATGVYSAAEQAQIDAFHAFIEGDSYLRSHRGQIAKRNASNMPWVNRLDFGVQQELPGFFEGNKTVVRLDIYNFLNLLNKDWGEQEGLGFFATRRLATVADVSNGQYQFNLPTATTPQNYSLYDSSGNPARVVSRWQALLTVRYEF